MKTSNGIDVLRTIWFSQATKIGQNGIPTEEKQIGIIYGRDTTTGEIKAYIGIADGQDEIADIDNIACWGTKFPTNAAALLMGFSKADPAKKSSASNEAEISAKALEEGAAYIIRKYGPNSMLSPRHAASEELLELAATYRTKGAKP